MKILSVDTSSIVCSVAILDDLNVLYEKSIDNALTHSEKLMPMIKEGLETIGLTIKDIDLFACSRGPGSFTGIRIGISTIKAFIDVFEKPAIGITSLEGLAYNIDNEGLILSLIDAKNDNAYAGLFSLQNGKYTPVSECMADNIDNILSYLKKYSNSNITFVGDGLHVYKDKLFSAFPHCTFADDILNKNNAISIGIAAFNKYNNGEFFNSLSPLYLRKSQAERMLEEGKNK